MRSDLLKAIRFCALLCLLDILISLDFLPRDGIALKKTEAKEAQENKQGQVTILLLRSVLTCAGKSLDQIEVVYSVISG